MNWTIRTAGVAVLGLTLAGCAKFPASGNTQFTKITFNVTMGGPINPNYLYYVAMYASTDQNPVYQNVAPVPVIASGSSNGWLTGAATNYVVMQPANLSRPYSIYSVGTPSAPGVDNTLTGNTNDQITLDGSGNYPTTWSFTIFTSQLANGNAILAQQFKSLTFQIIPMNKLASGSISGRIMDAIGQNANFQAQTVLLNSSYTVSNSTLGGIEPANDCVGGYDPALDITDFSVTVTPP